MATYLDRIVAHHRAQAARDERPLNDLRAAAESCPPVRGFRAALVGEQLAVIAEVKRRSPSRGDLKADLDPATLAASYQSGGAACISVLTDHEFFGGSTHDLQVARAACSIPVLRKDFTVSERDVIDARLAGADCVLLIAAVLSDSELGDYHSLATTLCLDVLVEVHDATELQRALHVGSTLVGVNQRDLVTFEVDHERAVRVAATIPPGVVSVAESGVRGPDDAAALRGAGYAAVLVGESLVTASDPAAAVAALIRAGDSPSKSARPAG